MKTAKKLAKLIAQAIPMADELLAGERKDRALFRKTIDEGIHMLYTRLMALTSEDSQRIAVIFNGHIPEELTHKIPHQKKRGS